MCDDDNLSGIGGEKDQAGGAVLIRIHVPDLNIHKCLQFYRQDLVWDVKQQCLASLPKELKESFNYGLFAPPCNGKIGKFLDEERPLSDYPFSGPVGYLELRYKRRLYKGLSVDEKQLKSLHTKSNLKRFLDYVSSGNTEKVTKMCGKGLDPNFHCAETGETPLSMAAVMKKPSKLLLALVNGGALLDYRTKDGSTAMHRAVEAKSLEAVKILLDLGGSPNYRDGKGLTPLYLSVSVNTDPALCEALLHDHAYLGAQDQQGWQETHQACRNGLIHHLEHLLYYGADMNARNASGNTPLHVCAVNNQEPSARLLLFRGGDKEALNFANQTPYQVAVIAGNMELAETIQDYRAQDVVPYRDLPKFNPNRRGIISRAYSDLRISGSMICLSTIGSRRSIISVGSGNDPSNLINGDNNINICGRRHEETLSTMPTSAPPSPSLSNRSLPPFSSASSSLSECSSSTNQTSHSHGGSSSCYSDSSYSEGSLSQFGSEDHCGSTMTDKSYDHSDITSDSSGVGTCNSGGSGSSYDATPTDSVLILPGMMVVCVENFIPEAIGHLKLTEGDIIEVTGSTDTGFLEGSLRGEMGIFPTSCVQEMRMKGFELSRNHLLPPSLRKCGGGAKKDSSLLSNGKQSGKLSRIKKIWGEPHTVILHRGQKGFGFVLRGAKADSPLMELQPSDRFPALQYLDDVDVNGVADRAGLRKGDFILAINGVDVSQSSHEAVVDFIRKSGDLVSMTVIGLSLPSMVEENAKPGSPASLTCEPGGTPKAQYHFATLPRKYSGSSGPIVPSPPRRDPNTSLTVGRARAKSMVAALADLEGTTMSTDTTVGVKSNSADSLAGKPPLPPQASTPVNTNATWQSKTASIRSRPTSSRITATEMQEIMATNGDNRQTPEAESVHKVYSSVSKMKRSKSGLKGSEAPNLHKDFHSTPDLKDSVKCANGDIEHEASSQDKKSLSQENLSGVKSNPRHSWACLSLANQQLLQRIHAEENFAWKSIGGPTVKPKISKNEPEGESESLSSSDTSGDEEPKCTSVKTSLPTESEYRTTKPLRPIQSKTLPRRASTGCTSLAPLEQQAIINLVPPGQVVKVDVSKSNEYASLDIASTLRSRDNSVMSSFKPNDSAKLYASPDDLKSIGYREASAEAGSGNTNNVCTLRKTCRSQSLPRGGLDDSPTSHNKSTDYALPETKEIGKEINGSCTSANSGSNIVDKRKAESDPNFDPQKSLQEAKERLKPVLKNNNNSTTPVLIPSVTPASTTANDGTRIRIEVKQSPRLTRKAEKTVTFQSEPITPGSGNQLPHSLSVDEFQKVKSNLKSSKSFPNDLGTEEHDGDGNSSSGVSSDSCPDGQQNLNSSSENTNTYVTCLPINPDSDSSEDASDKTWILKEENLPNNQRKPNNMGTEPNNYVNNRSTVFLSSGSQQQQDGLTNNSSSARNNNMRTSTQGNLTKNAVSLVQLPPPMELDNESDDHRSPKTTPILKKTQNVGTAPTTSTTTVPQMYHTLQPQRSKPMLGDQEMTSRQYQYAAATQLQGANRQAEKSIEESIKLIRMHVEALKEFPSVTPPPMSQTPILAPPPEFSDARDTHESATRFNQGQFAQMSTGSVDSHGQNFSRQSPLYRSISHTHSSNTSMYSGYPTMTRQQYQLQQQQQQYQLQQQQYQLLQQQQQVMLSQHKQSQQTSLPNSYTLQQQMSMSMPSYHTLGRSIPSTNAQPMLNSAAYGHYQTLSSVKQQQAAIATTSQAPQTQNLYQHHPKCYYYQQQSTATSTPAASTTVTGSGTTRYIPEKLHPVHRYTPDLYESTGPRIVGAIPKKPVGSDQYEIPHAHQQLLQQQQLQPQNTLPQQATTLQQQHQQGGRVVRREFRNKPLPDWSISDTCDWLESLFMPEYKSIFQQRHIDGKKLLRMDNATLLELGVKKLGHRMNIEKSLKRYLPQPKT